MDKTRLYVAAGASLLLYALLGYETWRGWSAHREAAALVAQAERYSAAHPGSLPECSCDFGFDEHHAFYERKSPERFVVDYFSALGSTQYDSASRSWHTRYWWSGRPAYTAPGQ